MGADGAARTRLGPLLAAGALLAALALALRWAQSPPAGPVEPSWNRTPCAHCGMLVGDPAHAAQLHTPAGEVRFFDDAGCLLLYVSERPDEAGAAWFHHFREPRWIPAASAGFVAAESTPMSYGLGAVDAAEPGALSRGAALSEVQKLEATRRGSAK